MGLSGPAHTDMTLFTGVLGPAPGPLVTLVTEVLGPTPGPLDPSDGPTTVTTISGH